MAEAKHSAHPEPNYVAIWGWLFILTVLEIVVYKLRIARPLMISSLVILALTKVCLVALFFMHLKFERQLMKVIAAVPLIVGGILLVGLFPDALHMLRFR